MSKHPKPVVHMVWFRIRSTPQLKKTHWQLHVIWVQDVTLQFHKTETEHKKKTGVKVIDLSDYLPCKICICLYMGSQGYDIKEKLLFQDNQSAIKTNQNGKKLCTGNPRHIDTSYFFYKDRVESNKISIKYCSTEHMPAYCFMKYIQGALFTKKFDVIMGRKHVNNLQMGPPSTK